MIRKEDLTDKELIEISTSLALQNALVNEIYPFMRRVVGCIDHDRKRFVLLVIYEGEIPDGFEDIMDGVLAEAMLGLPSDYEARLLLQRVDCPDGYRYDTEKWRCFYAFFRHENNELHRPKEIFIDLDRCFNSV